MKRTITMIVTAGLLAANPATVYAEEIDPWDRDLIQDTLERATGNNYTSITQIEITYNGGKTETFTISSMLGIRAFNDPACWFTFYPAQTWYFGSLQVQVWCQESDYDWNLNRKLQMNIYIGSSPYYQADQIACNASGVPDGAESMLCVEERLPHKGDP